MVKFPIYRSFEEIPSGSVIVDRFGSVGRFTISGSEATFEGHVTPGRQVALPVICLAPPQVLAHIQQQLHHDSLQGRLENQEKKYG